MKENCIRMFRTSKAGLKVRAYKTDPMKEEIHRLIETMNDRQTRVVLIFMQSYLN